MAPFKASRKAAVPRSADDAWVHDMAPGAPRAPKVASTLPAVAENNRLAVSNVHYEITEKDLTAIFGQIGTLVREPLIKYDRSGRSTGVAIITFETASEATKAKDQFQGVIAKGQPLSIEFDTQGPPRRRAASLPVTTARPSSLMQRMGLGGSKEKAPLISRLSGAEAKAKASLQASRRGPTRGGSHGARGAGRGVSSLASGGRGAKESKKPKTAQELDSELDAFMAPSSGTSAQSGAATGATIRGVSTSGSISALTTGNPQLATVAAMEDVEMA